MISNKSTYCIRIIDDEQDVCSALSFLLECDGWNCRTYYSAEEFLEKDDLLTSGCVLSDIRMPTMSGLILQIEMKNRGVDLPLIFISGHGDIEMAVDALRKGAIDFLVKPIKKEKLFNAIYTAIGKRYSDLSPQKTIKVLESLSKREKHILKFILEGLSTKLIAERLSISERTVQGHRWRTYQKLGVNNEDAVRKLIRKEWLKDYPTLY